MREKIILAPGINGTELLRSMALHGKSTFGVRIMSSVMLAKHALMCSGISITEKIISPVEENIYISSVVGDVSYFTRVTFADIQSITSAVRTMRYLCTESDECKYIGETMSKGIFEEKNAALVSVHSKYLELCKNNNLIDSVSIIRKAIAEAEPLDVDFEVIEGTTLSPLELKLLRKLSGGNYKTTTYSQLYGLENSGKVCINEYANCFGMSNEVEYIVDKIYKAGNLDKATVAVTDVASYSQLFFDLSILHNIPISFGTGVPLINSNPAKLLMAFNYWMTDGLYSKTALEAILTSPAFDRTKFLESMPAEEGMNMKHFYDVIYSLKFKNDRNINEEIVAKYKDAVQKLPEKDKAEKEMFIPAVEYFAKELSAPVEVFVSRYSKVRKDKTSWGSKLISRIDKDAVSTIYDELSTVRKSGIAQADSDIIKSVLKKRVCVQSAKRGHIHLTTFGSAALTLRKDMYIAGLASSVFPGSPKENYLLLDDDLNLFGRDAKYLLSEERIKGRLDIVHRLVSLCSDAGSNVFLSYSGQNVADLKKDNVSSVVYNIFRMESGINATSEELNARIKKIGYFDPDISVLTEIGRKYNEGIIAIKEKPEVKLPYRAAWNPDKSYSPSMLNMFFSCPRRFELTYLLGIAEPEDDRMFDVLAANKQGTLAHSIMEKLANTDMSRENFLKIASDDFDTYMKMNTPLISERVEGFKEEFIEMMGNAYDMDLHREVVLKEEDIECVHKPTKLKIHGLPDRVEKDSDSKYIIVDFKTGRTVEHAENDFNTCLQGIIYAYIMEQAGYDVKGIEFRYIRLGETVTCEYNQGMKKALTDAFKEFKEAMETGKFSRYVGDCKYCKHNEICERYITPEYEDEHGDEFEVMVDEAFAENIEKAIKGGLC